MSSIKSKLIISLCILVDFAYSQQIDYKGFEQWAWGKKDSTEYYLYTPSDSRQGERYPIVLFMHGCCGEDYHATLRNAVDPPVRMWHNFGANTQKIPTYILSPKTSSGWKQHFDNLKAIMDDLVLNHQGDPERIYVTGFSMGAQGTWEIIEKFPDYFAAAIPIGMDFKGKDPKNFKDIPIWAFRGEQDWYAQNLVKQITEIRKCNYNEADSGEWITGINPRLTTFKDMGHGVQWIAARTGEIIDWAYSKVNDGNKYPFVYFNSPGFNQEAKEGQLVPIHIEAKDPDGVIQKVELYVNDKLFKTLDAPPFTTTVKAIKGDTKIEAIAFDEMGKSSSTNTIVKVNIPAKIMNSKLQPAQQGAYYKTKPAASGNGKMEFNLSGNNKIPEGLQLTSDGIIQGVPVNPGKYSILINLIDEDGDLFEKELRLLVTKKNDEEVIVSNVRNYTGKSFPVSKVSLGQLPHGNRDDDEVTLSGGIEKYENMALIQTDANDTVSATPYYMEFEVDEDVIVYIAYEKLDNLYASTIPDWLREYQKEEESQIAAQYFYYDVYSKEFPKGKIFLPDAEEKKNGVNTNYFVMIRKKEK